MSAKPKEIGLLNNKITMSNTKEIDLKRPICLQSVIQIFPVISIFPVI